MPHDHDQSALQELQSVSSIADLCKDWQSKYRSILVSAQAVLRIFYPHGSQAIGTIITLLDGFCSAPPPTPPAP
jgi:hypothetical protein